MKALFRLFIAAVFTFAIFSKANAQVTNIAVAIAYEKSGNCNSSDLGYYYYHDGAVSAYKLSEKAKAKVRANYSSCSGVDTRTNSYTDKNYLVIVETTTDKDGCRRHTFGVGFGTNRSEALKTAVSHMSGRNWDWSKSDDYSIVIDQQY